VLEVICHRLQEVVRIVAKDGVVQQAKNRQCTDGSETHTAEKFFYFNAYAEDSFTVTAAVWMTGMPT